jgi:osmotically-inducible protein OsmY
VSVLAVSGLLAGCAQLLAIPVQPVIMVAEDRHLSETKDDIGIKASILNAFAGESYGLLVDISTDVYESEVMLTGSVKKNAERRKAVELARRVDGVKYLYNEIQVTKEGGIGASAKDTGIELKLDVYLLGAAGVGSINLRWRSVNGVVYYIGQVHSQEEFDKVMRITHAVNGVKNVVSHIRIRLASGS